MAKTTPSKVKKTKKDKSAKKKKRKLDDAAATPKKKKLKVEKESSAKKKKKKKLKKGDTETPKKKKKKGKKAKTPDAKSTGKKKKKAKTVDATSSGKKKKKKGKKANSAKKKKVKKEKKVAKEEEEEEAAAPAQTDEVKVEEEGAAAAEAAPAATADDGATVKCFVGNLSYDMTEEVIKEFFKDCGTITDVFWLESKDDGKFMGKGFITFETVDQARLAFAKKDEDLMGRPILVDYAQPRKSGGTGQREARPLSERPEGCTTVFLGNLDFKIEESDVKAFAKDCGEIKSIRWLTDRDTGDFKGCGFAEFTTSEGVDKFIKLNGQSVKGRAIRIDYAKARTGGGGGGGNREPRALSEKPEGCCTVFVGNLDFNITEEAIHDLAKECGDGVKNVRWLTDRETQEFKGCGFVEFYDTESVDKFVAFNGKDVLGRSIRIDYAKPRAPRKEY